jgi:phenylpropionate dioxygenase-like ring-hydroxylating dioxygenase large terminal subunit
MIPISYYRDQSIFDFERGNYFSQNFFVGTDSNLSNVNDYKTVNNYFEPITIRNVGDKIKVFSNVCLHRSGLIDINEVGNAPFSCKYHGWTYSSNGEILKTPLDESMRKCGRRLSEIEAVSESGFIFIKPDRDFIGKFNNACRNFGINKTNLFYKASIVHNCNWKILVENVLEPYHISFVHKDSFVPLGLSSVSECEWIDLDIGSYNKVVSRKDSNKYYSHFSAGANLFVSDTNGAIIFVSYFLPISPGKTILFYELWENKSFSERKDYLRKIVREKSIEFTNKVLMEDKQIVEAAQIGVNSSKCNYILSELAEPRVIDFHKKYLKLMGGL